MSCLEPHTRSTWYSTYPGCLSIIHLMKNSPNPFCQLPCSQNCETRTSLHRIWPKLLIESSPSRLEPIDSSPSRIDSQTSVCWPTENYLDRFLFDSSHRRLSVDRRWNHLDRVLVESSPQRPSVNRHWNNLARVPVVCPSTDVKTVDSHPSGMSLDRCNL